MEPVFDPPCDDRMAGIIAALGADDVVCRLGQKIDDLSLAFIPPLQTDDSDTIRHFNISLANVSNHTLSLHFAGTLFYNITREEKQPVG